ncbi:MAG: 50S ribosome-binding GTPase [Actinomycetales bacterium]|jgi:GTP-binding protein EngB required for normal cell division|nr:50S ribosome-binding GTPase [Actinomycetales bacterium]
MSPIRAGSARLSVAAVELTEQASALAMAIDSGGRELDPSQVDLAVNVVEKVRERTSIAGGHTVVALAGATGSGKSSLFNAIVGRPVAKIGARRPTTSVPSAAIWGPEPAGELLDWLGVATRHQIAADESAVIGRLDGLVLLDLPDFDSRVAAHRAEAQRVLELVDVFVWVTDPQKYADALLHDDYVAALSGHESVTIVVLNQADRLAPDAVDSCRADLTRLLAADGLGDAKVMVTSARTGAGVDELRQRLANAVAGADAARARLSADVVAVAGRLRSGVADAEPEVRGSADDALVDALSRSAGVPVVLEAVAEDYRREATSHGGWLFTRWVSGFRADPLARLRLDKTVVKIKGIDETDVRAVVGRSSIPPPSPAARAAVSLAIRQLADRAAEGMPVRWANAVADAADPGAAGLSDALDQAVIHTPLRARQPVWWRVMDVVQWIFGLVTLAGFLWLTALFVVGWLQLPDLPTPTVGQLPVPFLLLAGGIACGLLAAALNRLFVRVGSRRRANVVARRLHDAIAEVADSRIVAPVLAILERHRVVREALDRARHAR